MVVNSFFFPGGEVSGIWVGGAALVPGLGGLFGIRLFTETRDPDIYCDTVEKLAIGWNENNLLFFRTVERGEGYNGPGNRIY